MDESNLRSACDRLEAAFAGQEDFAEALDAAAAAVGARGAAIIPLAADNDHRPTSSRILEVAHDYNAYWHRHDLRMSAAGTMLRTGVAVDQDIVSPEAMARLPFYTRYLARHGLKWFAGIPFRDGSEAWGLTFQRTAEQGLFEVAEQQRLRRMGCALSQAVSIARRVAAARDHGVMEGLRLAGSPAILLDRQCRILLVSDGCPDALRHELHLTIGQPFLAASVQFNRLKECVASVLHPASPADAPERLPLVVPRPGRRPLVIRVRALHDAGTRFYRGASVLVILDDLDRRDRRSAELLVHIFGLTPAQARIATMIAAGHTVTQCAQDLNIDVETVRSTLKKAFQKMDVSRQPDLVLLVGRLSSFGVH